MLKRGQSFVIRFFVDPPRSCESDDFRFIRLAVDNAAEIPTVYFGLQQITVVESGGMFEQIQGSEKSPP